MFWKIKNRKLSIVLASKSISLKSSLFGCFTVPRSNSFSIHTNAPDPSSSRLDKVDSHVSRGVISSYFCIPLIFCWSRFSKVINGVVERIFIFVVNKNFWIFYSKDKTMHGKASPFAQIVFVVSIGVVRFHSFRPMSKPAMFHQFFIFPCIDNHILSARERYASAQYPIRINKLFITDSSANKLHFALQASFGEIVFDCSAIALTVIAGTCIIALRLDHLFAQVAHRLTSTERVQAALFPLFYNESFGME